LRRTIIQQRLSTSLRYYLRSPLCSMSCHLPREFGALRMDFVRRDIVWATVVRLREQFSYS
jgi:hypothetical protein